MPVAMLRPQANQRAVTAEIIDLTPEKAAAILKKNNKNRPLRDRYAKRLASAMARGEWKFNGDTIVVADSGELLQGQHRCTAVVLSGVTIKTILVEGVPEECFDTYDRGIGRTSSDIFAIANVKNASVVASMTRLICQHRISGNPFTASQETLPTMQQIESAFHEDQDLISECASYAGSKAWCRKYVSPSIAGFCLYTFSKWDKKTAFDFFERLESGSLLEPGSPILLLRDRLQEEREKKGRINTAYKTALIFKAFKLHIDGATVKHLRVRTDGDAPEKNIYVI